MRVLNSYDKMSADMCIIIEETEKKSDRENEVYYDGKRYIRHDKRTCHVEKV